MPRITVAGGPSNAAARPGEVGHVPPPQDRIEDGAPVAFEGEHGPEPTDLPPGSPVLPEGWVSADAPDTPDYESMKLEQLRAEAKSRELPVGGTKAELAARLAQHDTAASGE